MRTKTIELDVDFIGGQGSLTVEEEKALSNYFRQRKVASQKNIATQFLKKIKKTKIAA